jgi:NhaP-type Na+/H+ and K+/H+ antiporter
MQTSVAEFVRTKLPRKPTLGDRIRFENIELVVREMNGKRITRIGLELDPDERGLDFMSGSSPAPVRPT